VFEPTDCALDDVAAAIGVGVEHERTTWLDFNRVGFAGLSARHEASDALHMYVQFFGDIVGGSIFVLWFAHTTSLAYLGTSHEKPRRGAGKSAEVDQENEGG
jgi:hypothetical protein